MPYTRKAAFCVWLQGGLVNTGGSRHLGCNLLTFWGQLSFFRGCKVRRRWEDHRPSCHPPRCRTLRRNCCLRPQEDPSSLHQRVHQRLCTQGKGEGENEFSQSARTWNCYPISGQSSEDGGAHSPLFLWLCLACLSTSLLPESTGELHLGSVSVL